MVLILLGAFLVIAGLLLICQKTLDLGRLSGTRRHGAMPRQGTLEPPTRSIQDFSASQPSGQASP